MGNMRCSKCGSDNREGRKFCTNCGAPLIATCSNCGAAFQPGEKFCGECGAPLSDTLARKDDKASDSQHGPTTRVSTESAATNVTDGERKTVSALFADLKGSTALMESLDPEEARAIVDPALKIMVEAVRAYEGYVVQSTGDGIFALFGAPNAYEDHPQRALYAALQMQQEMREYAQQLAAQKHLKPMAASLAARIGISTGEVVVRTVETGGKVEYTPIGHTTNLASRLQAVAREGSIALSEHTRKLVEGYFELRALGPISIKGISEPLNIYEVVGPGPLRTRFELSARRGLTRFIGRERELQQINHALELAMSGQGQLVAVVAEAGTGKSRLFHEFKVKLPVGCKMLEANSISHGKASAWLPVLQLLRGYFSIQDDDDLASRREKVRAAVAGLDPTISDVLPYLWGLLGIQQSPDPLAQMDPQVRRHRTLNAIKRVAFRESLNQPTVVIFEDLHWIDAESQALLDLLADSLGGAHLLLLVNYRPEYRHQWSGRSHYLQLRLDPLATQNAGAMLAALLGEGAELDALKQLIAERTGGNPFFIEEMVQALFEQGILARNGDVKLVRPLVAAHLPVTVHGVLAARMDRLPPRDKELLQTVAVIGNEFPLALVRRVSRLSDDGLERGLANLQLAEFIYDRPWLPDVEYSFKHALTYEVAYSSLLIEHRKLMHERAGQALESMFAEHLDDHLGELARHYSRSNNVRKAVDYLARAGQQALHRSASADAISKLNMAIDLLQSLPDTPKRAQQELALQILLGPALIAIKGNAAPEVQKTYQRALDLCRPCGDSSQLFQVMFGLRSFYVVKGQLQEAHELGEQLLRLAKSLSDTDLLLETHLALGNTFFMRGDHIHAQAHLEQGIALYDPQRHRSHAASYGVDPGLMCLAFLARVQWVLGHVDQARRSAQRVMDLARDLNHSFSLAYAFIFHATLGQFLRDAAATYQWAETAIKLSNEHGFTAYTAIGNIFAGCALSERGQTQEGLDRVSQGLTTLQDTGARLWCPAYLTWLAEMHRKIGKLKEGLSVLREAQALIDQSSERLWEAEVYRLTGELTLQFQRSNRTSPTTEPQPVDSTSRSQAEACFRKAIEIARSQQAKSLELRAAMSLSRLWHRCGEKKTAYEL